MRRELTGREDSSLSDGRGEEADDETEVGAANSDTGGGRVCNQGNSSSIVSSGGDAGETCSEDEGSSEDVKAQYELRWERAQQAREEEEGSSGDVEAQHEMQLVEEARALAEEQRTGITTLRLLLVGSEKE